MTVLVTGALGYVGNYLCAELRREGIDFVSIDASLFHHVVRENEVKFYGSLVPSDFENIDSIIHLGGISNDPMGNRYSELTHKVNYIDSCNLLSAAISAGHIEKFIFASSCSIYGAVADGESVDESSQTQPLTAYAKSKVEFEAKMKEAAELREIEFTAFRFATACGVSNSMRLDLVLNNFVDSALRNNEIVLNSSGLSNRPLIDVADMARILVWQLKRPKSIGFDVFNGGYDCNNIKIKDLAMMVAKQLNIKKISFPDGDVHDLRSYLVSFEKLRYHSGFSGPKVSLNDSINNLVDFHRSNNGWVAKTNPMMKGNALTRLDVLPSVLNRLQ